MKGVALIVFVKNFQLGKVKTRIGNTAGDEKALDIYTQLCTFTVKEAIKTGLEVYFYFSDHIDIEFLKEAEVISDENQTRYRVQKGENLGMRMHRAFQEVLSLHEMAFILGTDCPYLGTKDIIAAVTLLQTRDTDVVIGPADDGGYYGLGMKKSWDLFSGIDWSTDQVYRETISKVEELQLETNILPVLKDVDYESDWVDFCNSTAAPFFHEVIRSSSFDNNKVGE